MSFVRPKSRAPAVESLEPRQLLATVYPEVEPNNTLGSATPAALDSGGAMTLTGTVSSATSDRDVFRFYADRTTALDIRITSSRTGSTLTVSGSSGEILVDGARSNATLYVGVGKTYFFSLRRTGTETSSYGVFVGTRATYAGPSTTPVPDVLRWRMTKGVNIPAWFWNLPGGDPTSRMASYVTQTDVNRLKSLGVRHVRLPVETNYFADWSNPGTLKTTYLGPLKNAIDLMLRNDIAVIVSPFGDYNSRTLSQPNNAVVFMRAFAKWLSQFDPAKLVIQTANEPDGTPATWFYTQARVIDAIRSQAPSHTILTATTLQYGPGVYGTVEAITQSPPYADKNVLYGFHFYEPFPFTHQGAFWAFPGYGNLYALPYPSTPTNVKWIVDDLSKKGLWTLANQVRAYGAEYWSAAKVKSRIQQVANWASRNNVAVMADEFGVFADGGVVASNRDAYLRDVRTALESLNFGWNMWDFADGFGLFAGSTPSTRYVRQSTAQALGLFV
jgi:endoglucanase